MLIFIFRIKTYIQYMCSISSHNKAILIYIYSSFLEDHSSQRVRLGGAARHRRLGQERQSQPRCRQRQAAAGAPDHGRLDGVGGYRIG